MREAFDLYVLSPVAFAEGNAAIFAAKHSNLCAPLQQILQATLAGCDQGDGATMKDRCLNRVRPREAASLDWSI